jgi:rare lipoprotein A
MVRPLRTEAIMNIRTIFAVLMLLLLIRTVCRAESGVASWYGHEVAGRTMANGKIFNPKAILCASRKYPLGTRLLVTNIANGRSVAVIVSDRGPAKRLGRTIDLSQAAFKQIADTRLGLIQVKIEKL